MFCFLLDDFFFEEKIEQYAKIRYIIAKRK